MPEISGLSYLYLGCQGVLGNVRHCAVLRSEHLHHIVAIYHWC